MAQKVCGHALDAKIDEGSSGAIFTITDNGKSVVKRFNLNSSLKSDGRFRGVEIDVMTRLRHPNLMPAQEVNTPADDKCNEYVIRMEKATAVLSKNEVASVDHRLDIMFDICCATAFLHEQGILHCDIRPANEVLIGKRAVLIDYGSIRYFDPRTPDARILTDQNWIHMPPEMYSMFEDDRLSYIHGVKSEIWELGANLIDIFIDSTYSTGTEYTTKNRAATFAWINKAYKGDAVIRQTLSKIIDIKIFEGTAQKNYKQASRPVASEVGEADKLKASQDMKTYKDQVIDLVARMMPYDSKERIDMKQVLLHPLFRGRKAPQGQIVENKETYTNIGRHLPRILKMFSQVGTVEEMFLAIDILYRTAHIAPTDDITWFTCIWMARKFLEFPLPEDYVSISTLEVAYELVFDKGINGKKALELEAQIYKSLRGRIYRRYIYHACSSPDELKAALLQIIPDVKLYANVDLANIRNVLKVTPLPKNIAAAALLT
jgi:serine/threonine protein kinase